jgi:PHD/YefM family antitoxin component YafN of YafNO toxin-antitoxin module
MPATVTVDQLQKNARRIVARARKQPLRVTDEHGEPVMMLSMGEYKELSGQTLHELLLRRFKEKPRYTNEEARALTKAHLRKLKRRA